MGPVETRGGMPAETRGSPPGQISGDTKTADEHVIAGAAPGIERPQPTDAPGSGGAFTKTSSGGPGGWGSIDDVAGGSGWQQT